ncbi:hypothetical protein TNIN_60871 [Trichonephila inaurata madagascariensis]|uniref:Uncharacterized protein n=1 Tax=Trichonephila inaurata madagascariensis TaxID=2747483 RepID=A0A8X6X3F6_9ARAC|nr:hypothetical protein TNIN_60871 [Trichonephila inaurata madagascariensis]
MCECTDKSSFLAPCQWFGSHVTQCTLNRERSRGERLDCSSSSNPCALELLLRPSISDDFGIGAHLDVMENCCAHAERSASRSFFSGLVDYR